ncbi:hypothetical protein MN116_006729 [Schistosoma mekongi]|uniref:CEP63/Deup1 N-terminal domain-containing protein n=1 Tax=Schistosoma mekongi TaxID=38744 RepID=A0AAE1Z961_SCHME|nr:hypothetical protein MN116_006729 [Schistosoma mekongi]
MSVALTPLNCLEDDEKQKLKDNTLKNFGFLVPHMSDFEYELQELLVEIDMLIERKKSDWGKDLCDLERKLSDKVSENNKLKDLVSEKERDLQDALRRLHIIESKNPDTYYDKQIEELSCKVDAMKASYNNLQRKYQKQLVAEKSDFSMHLHNLEKENEALKAEYEKMRQKNEQTISSLKQQLIEQKNGISNFQKQYDDLKSQLKTKLQGEIDHKNNIQEIKEQHKLAIDELSKQLNDHKTTIKLQAEELKIAKLSLTNKNSEIHLPHEAELKKPVFTNSQKSAKRLEKTVTKHLNLLLHRKHNSTPNISVKCETVSPTDSQQPIDNQQEIVHKVRYLENQLNEANNALIEKMLEISRLENTCQTASTTIRRLVESKVYSNGGTKSLGTSISKACEKVRNFEKKLSLVEKDLSTKLSRSVSELCRLKKFVNEIESFRSYEANQAAKSCTLEAAVQTSEYLLSTNEELTKVTPTVIFDNKTSENITPSDLLTSAEELNETYNNFSTGPSSTQFTSHFSNVDIHTVPIDLIDKKIGMKINNSEVQVDKGIKCSSNVTTDFHNSISLLNYSTDIDNDSKNLEQLTQITPKKPPVNEKQNWVFSECKPVPSVRFTKSSIRLPNDNTNLNRSAFVDLNKHDETNALQSTISTSTSSASDVLKFAEINDNISSQFSDPHYPNYPCDSIKIISTSVPHFSACNKDLTFIESETNSHYNELLNSPNLQSSIRNIGNHHHQHQPYYSTIEPTLYNSQINYYNLTEEDTTVYNLAAQFLADEQKHSILLEQQIDEHLNCLNEHAKYLNELY